MFANYPIYLLVSNIPRLCERVTAHYGFPEFVECIRRFLYDQLNPDAEMPGDQVNLRNCPAFDGEIKVFSLVLATYHAPSDHLGEGGMHQDIICCTPQWWGGAAQYDCILVAGGGSEVDPIGGLLVAHVLLFFSFRHQGHSYSCALVEWLLPISNKRNGLTGMWIVVPEVNAARQQVRAVISVKMILQGVHLVGVYGEELLPVTFHFSESLNAFNTYYVNKYIDHHSYTIC
jgi:hypothetical protein